eukprot:CAMPEP_0198730176 /NCGR_PEP_ID=MMETSP1475-20131203/23195_1 /TAXON_ID= ORGANISM="Unidentified sp., Strain CCMP1999" /NCGR_SAMPLE_ID=MMETSP1475 /ASSEMBLY_ACC=CAM_ASM_001111 /LENGTH=309 /DNA_ID=CAMNT_0044492947 /DNA_START=17 /DNA_END=942 /DNA_ORIENTATION=-
MKKAWMGLLLVALGAVCGAAPVQMRSITITSSVSGSTGEGDEADHVMITFREPKTLDSAEVDEVRLILSKLAVPEDAVERVLDAGEMVKAIKVKMGEKEIVQKLSTKLRGSPVTVSAANSEGVSVEEVSEEKATELRHNLRKKALVQAQTSASDLAKTLGASTGQIIDMTFTDSDTSSSGVVNCGVSIKIELIYDDDEAEVGAESDSTISSEVEEEKDDENVDAQEADESRSKNAPPLLRYGSGYASSSDADNAGSEQSSTSSSTTPNLGGSESAHTTTHSSTDRTDSFRGSAASSAHITNADGQEMTL